MPDTIKEANKTYDAVIDFHYDEAPPSVEDILNYAEDLDHEGGKHLTFDWADTEIRKGRLGFVRAGLVAQKVKYYKLYQKSQQKLKDFRDYCESYLGKALWQINRLIEAARVTLELARAGFSILPQCEAQARPLAKFTGEALQQKWLEVVQTVPSQKITAAIVAEIVDGEQPGKKKQLKLDAEVYKKLVGRATLAGTTPEKLIEQMLNGYVEEEVVPIGTEETTEVEVVEDGTPGEVVVASVRKSRVQEKFAPIGTRELDAWLADMQLLLVEQFGAAVGGAVGTG